MLAGIATVGMGGAVGLEGPSIYAGATVGSGIQRKFSWLFGDKGGQALLVAGAAAGVSAIFQAPLGGGPCYLHFCLVHQVMSHLY